MDTGHLTNLRVLLLRQAGQIPRDYKVWTEGAACACWMAEGWFDKAADGHRAWNNPIARAMRHEKSSFLIVGDGVHWRAVIIDSRALRVWLFDPFGGGFAGGEAAGLKRAAIRAAERQSAASDKPWVAEVMSLRMQYDGYNCGIWCTWVWEQYLGFLKRQHVFAGSFADFLLLEYDSASSAAESNSSFVQGLRVAYSALLTAALATEESVQSLVQSATQLAEDVQAACINLISDSDDDATDQVRVIMFI